MEEEVVHKEEERPLDGQVVQILTDLLPVDIGGSRRPL